MELSTATYEVLGKNKDNTIRIKLVLSAIPTASWTALFNNKADAIRSVVNTPILILQDTAQNINQRNIVKAVQTLIHVVDEELLSDSKKNAAMLAGLKKGNVVAHDNLSYDSSQYQQFLSKINSNRIL